MAANGNIRLVPEINGVNLSQKPSDEQLSALRGFIRYHNWEVRADIDNAAGRTLETFGYYKGTSEVMIISDINNYFETGEVPAPQSDLAAFRSRLKGFNRTPYSTAVTYDSAAVREAAKTGQAVTNDGYEITVARGQRLHGLHLQGGESPVRPRDKEHALKRNKDPVYLLSIPPQVKPRNKKRRPRRERRSFYGQAFKYYNGNGFLSLLEDQGKHLFGDAFIGGVLD